MTVNFFMRSHVLNKLFCYVLNFCGDVMHYSCSVQDYMTFELFLSVELLFVLSDWF